MGGIQIIAYFRALGFSLAFVNFLNNSSTSPQGGICPGMALPSLLSLTVFKFCRVLCRGCDRRQGPPPRGFQLTSQQRAPAEGGREAGWEGSWLGTDAGAGAVLPPGMSGVLSRDRGRFAPGCWKVSRHLGSPLPASQTDPVPGCYPDCSKDLPNRPVAYDGRKQWRPPFRMQAGTKSNMAWAARRLASGSQRAT